MDTSIIKNNPYGAALAIRIPKEIASNRLDVTKIKRGEKSKHIEDSFEAFMFLSTDWNEDDLFEKKQYKVLGLDDNDFIVCKVSYFANSMYKENLEQIITIAHQYKATKVYFAENMPNQQLRPSQRRISYASRLKQFGHSIGVPVVDQLIMSSQSYFSFNDNNI